MSVAMIMYFSERSCTLCTSELQGYFFIGEAFISRITPLLGRIISVLFPGARTNRKS